MTTIGLLHPGEMGASVGASGRTGGHRVLWASQGRGADTTKRAAAAGLEDAGTVAKLVGASDVVLSVCPPHAALDVARSVAGHGFRKLYVQLGFIRFNVLANLLIWMAALPIKMVLRWVFNLKYIVAIPEYFFNI